MRVIHTIETDDHICPYLQDRVARLEYSYAIRLSPDEYEQLMNRGYRKFGVQLFRNVCVGCSECRPIRVDLNRFSPDRSQRRAMKRNERLVVRAGPPSIDDDHLDLYHRYHQAQSERKGWPANQRDAQEYECFFVRNQVPAIELSLWSDDRLIGVVLTEITPNTISGIYHYYEPELMHLGLGTFGMLQTIELGKRLSKPWAYFGFYVRGCASMEYKARFRPCELMGEDGSWRPFLD